VPSAKSAKGARKLNSLFVNISNSPYFGLEHHCPKF
jgi:hypothetical protein